METKLKSKAMDAKDRMTHKAMDTKDKMTQSVQDATLSTKERIKDQFTKKMDEFKIPKAFFGGNSNSSSASASNGVGSAQTIPKSASTTSQKAIESTTLRDTTNSNIIPSSQSKLSKLSALLPKRETILSSAATSVLTKTVSETTSNLSTQLQATVHKTFKWLWWWGLAAVGVYGISTTLTKEGVKVLKDLVGGSVGGSGSGEDKSSSYTTSSSVTKGSSGAIKDGNSVVVESDYINGGFDVIVDENNSNSDADTRANGGYLSWLSSWRRG